MEGRLRVKLVACSLLMAAGTACGSSLPARYVIEHDLGAYAFRRYQKSYDIEVPVADNQATAHTAAYLQRTAADEVEVVTAFVAVYAKAKSLAAEARAALSTLSGYQLKPAQLYGEHVWLMTGGREQWCVWVSQNHLVKIGAPTQLAFPEAIVEAYADLYPSDLDQYGAARSDAPSAGEAQASRALDGEMDATAAPKSERPSP
jgi:hypothetical protein